MKRRCLTLALTAFFTISGNVSYAQSKNYEQDAQSPYLKEFAITSIPMGHAQFCQTNINECSYQSDKVYRMRLTPQRWEQLLQVNNEVNNTIEAKTDKEIYAVDEYWTLPLSNVGDCEDFALLKRKKLIEMGWHPSTLRLTVVLDEKNAGHAVLTASTDRGDLVLDNVRNPILKWNDIDYTYIKRQSGFDSQTWVSLRTSPISVTVSNTDY